MPRGFHGSGVGVNAIAHGYPCMTKREDIVATRLRQRLTERRSTDESRRQFSAHRDALHQGALVDHSVAQERAMEVAFDEQCSSQIRAQKVGLGQLAFDDSRVGKLGANELRRTVFDADFQLDERGAAKLDAVGAIGKQRTVAEIRPIAAQIVHVTAGKFDAFDERFSRHSSVRLQSVNVARVTVADVMLALRHLCD